METIKWNGEELKYDPNDLIPLLARVAQITREGVSLEKHSKLYITLMNQALGDTELPEGVWKKIAKVNQLILDK